MTSLYIADTVFLNERRNSNVRTKMSDINEVTFKLAKKYFMFVH